MQASCNRRHASSRPCVLGFALESSLFPSKAVSPQNEKRRFEIDDFALLSLARLANFATLVMKALQKLDNNQPGRRLCN